MEKTTGAQISQFPRDDDSPSDAVSDGQTSSDAVIIGGTVGGGLVIIIIIVVLIVALVLLFRKQQRLEAGMYHIAISLLESAWSNGLRC